MDVAAAADDDDDDDAARRDRRDVFLENARLRADLAAHVATLATMDPNRRGGGDVSSSPPSPLSSARDEVATALKLRDDEAAALRAEVETLRSAVAARDARVQSLREKMNAMGSSVGE
jgi:hypothetical protein